jgi:tetratricopeptide (TPR) repeat protein
VSLIVSGGVQRVNDDISVSLQLEDAYTGKVVWAKQYEAPLAQLSSEQRRMRADLAAALMKRHGGDVEAAALPPDAGTDNVLAFEQYSQARLLLERPETRGYRAAVDLLRSAIEMDPGFTLAHAALGRAYWLLYEETLDRQWTERATKSVLEALGLDNSQPQVRLSLATIYQGSGELEKAAAEARRAIELQPNSDEAHRLLADILIEQERGDEAMQEVQIALRLRPRFWKNHNELGYIHYRQGRFVDAERVYTASIGLQPDNARSYHMLGSVYLAMGQPERALEPLTRANEMHPQAESLSNLGTIHYWAGRYNDAAAAYREAARLKPRDPIYHRNLGDALQQLGARRQAREAYARAVHATEELLAVNPRDPSTQAMLAVHLAKIGRFDAAIDAAVKAEAAAPNNGEVLYGKAVVLALGGDREASLEALRRAIQNGASAAVAEKDDDLTALRSMPGFQQLTGTTSR